MEFLNKNQVLIINGDSYWRFTGTQTGDGIELENLKGSSIHHP